MKTLLLATALLALPAAAQAPPVPLFEKALADMPGKEMTLVEVVLPPGGASPAHRHNAHVLVYVLEGQIEMQVKGQPVQLLGVGQTFYERPSDIHTVGRNPSTMQRARFLAYFIKSKGAPRTVPVP
ncbi:cupin domain-containing protein [Sandarakinorhabdus oryzae]|uniref:cupin domain-containing protein n=1 Tax=Sandarakinorhabdus oryzae TaxID=2675220 RepID=UPI0012E1E689|nr:cupin domain-containing protein [Sandarakinorhabdus oryzae]